MNTNDNRNVQPDEHAETPPRPVHEGRVIPPASPTRLAEAEADMARRMAMFYIEMPRRRLSDLVTAEDTRKQINSLLTRIKYQHILYEDFGLGEIDPSGGRTAINLYGPPGTGKSFAAEAIAAELGMGLIRVNYAEIESKFVGDTPKNIRAAFQKARETSAVLFFDEADSILGRRLSNITQSTDHAVNVSRSVMLVELDRFSGVAIFATNLASNYDPAFVRRILGHIEMPLPDGEARLRLWRMHLPARMPVQLSESDWRVLVDQTDGLAGGDIFNSVIAAASAALEREGSTCRVRLDDFLQAVTAIRKARQAVGLPGQADLQGRDST